MALMKEVLGKNIWLRSVGVNKLYKPTLKSLHENKDDIVFCSYEESISPYIVS